MIEKDYRTSEGHSWNGTQDSLNPHETSADCRRFMANPDFMLREIAGESVLIPVGEAGIFENSVISLNETCSFLWQLYQTPRTVEEVVAEARKEYSDPDGMMETQIREFTNAYLQYGLLREEK